MKTACIALCALIFLAGCRGSTITETRPPVSAQCEDRCFQPCTEEDLSIPLPWGGDPESAEAWDRLVDETVFPLADELRSCELNRQSCVKCLDRLKKAGVIQ